jgi:hypothetical protein
VSDLAYFVVRVSVTERDLAVGGRDCLHCPVALAVGRALPAADVRVFADRIYLDYRPHETPQLVRDFVCEWDDVYTPKRRDGAYFAPFEFELTVWVPEWDAVRFSRANGLDCVTEEAA